jgi:hypothetical protein
MKCRARIAPALVALAISLLVTLGYSRSSTANVAYTSPYTYEQTFGTALRLVRVELGLKVVEKDESAGYLLFEYKSPESGKQTSTGSMQFVRNKGRTQVSVQLPSMPSYHEQMVVDALAKKLASDHGAPVSLGPPDGAPSEDAGAPKDDGG